MRILLPSWCVKVASIGRNIYTLRSALRQVFCPIGIASLLFDTSVRARLYLPRQRGRGVLPTISLEPVDSVSITSVVDKVRDMLLPDQGPARRPSIRANHRVRRRRAQMVLPDCGGARPLHRQSRPLFRRHSSRSRWYAAGTLRKINNNREAKWNS